MQTLKRDERSNQKRVKGKQCQVEERKQGENKEKYKQTDSLNTWTPWK